MQRDALRTLWTQCFGNEDDWIGCFFATAFSPERCRVLIRQGQLAAALCWMDVSCDGRKLAYLYAIATAPEFRRQGLCRELTKLTHKALARQGYAGAILVPAEDALRTLYEKLGYVNFGGVTNLHAQAGTPVPLRPLAPAEYSALRRTLLPAGGVIQENGAVEFLASGTKLYAGEDCLLAMAGGFGVELLGNPDAASGVLAALGLAQGAFRIPGTSPFAMFHPLKDDGWMPGYFGLAFE